MTVDDVAASARMVPMLPCGDVDELAAFWQQLGLSLAYRQTRPNPFIALERGAIALQYYGLPGWDPEQSHSTCAIAVTDTEPLYELFAAGLRAQHGKVPVSGLPRMTRPRRRANNGGLSGFSLVDPAGNWVRVSRAPGPADGAAVTSNENATAPWTRSDGGPVARALDSAVVLADSHGDEAQASKVLDGALRRTPDAPLAERVPALAFLVELAVRLEDAATEAAARNELEGLAASDLSDSDRATVAAALADLE
ncbi:hypothetical protein [Antribacter gilvus]|uniref:hypothetical protein n=1 Tax=Antribacter gilvus TaxID=2304675 RepID=UPI00197E2F79|nr:hypothetical protein [Antribacter gilvus]